MIDDDELCDCSCEHADYIIDAGDECTDERCGYCGLEL